MPNNLIEATEALERDDFSREFMGENTDIAYDCDDKYIGSVLKIRQFPLVAHKTEGCRIIDPDGREYLDFTASWAVAQAKRLPVLTGGKIYSFSRRH